MTIRLSLPRGFSFARTVKSHGWSVLPPFETNGDRPVLRGVARLRGGQPVEFSVDQPEPRALVVRAGLNGQAPPAARQGLISVVRSCLRLDEDYSEFYREAKRYAPFRWIPKTGSGRLLRAPTVFEDVVKMICTTNCSWALTETMVRNLCLKLGEPVGRERRAFPLPDAIAAQSESWLRKEIRAGYRAPYLLEFARSIVRGEIDPEGWRSSSLTTEELFMAVRRVKGVGPYAAGNILKLLGKYDHLAIDSWCRKQFSALHANGRKVSDRRIEAFYDRFGKWRGLFFWLDVTKHWQESGAML